MQKCVFILFTLGETFSTMLSARHTLSHIDSTFIAPQTEFFVFEPKTVDVEKVEVHSDWNDVVENSDMAVNVEDAKKQAEFIKSF